MAKPRAKSGMKRSPAKRRPRKAKAGTRGLLPAESRLDSLPGDAQEVRDRIEREGGLVVGAYNDPLGKTRCCSPSCRSRASSRRPFSGPVADSPQKARRRPGPHRHVPRPGDRGHGAEGGFLDAQRKASPRGDAPSRRESITALVVPKREIAWQILALNTEKAHNLRERARRGDPHLPRPHGRGREAHRERLLLLPEEASFVTLGVCYEKNGKFAGGAYNPIVRRLKKFSEEPLSKAIKSTKGTPKS